MSVDERLVRLLDDAAVHRTPCPQLPGMSLDMAYAVQRSVVNRRVSRGERLAGVKLGFTSPAKAAQMGVADVIAGQLTAEMAVDQAISLATCIHPRIEPELAFRMGPRGVPDAVAPALEIIDSRYRDFRFALSDVVADNASAAGFVLGDWRPVENLNHRDVVLEVDGTVVQTGSTADILGDPMQAVGAALRLTRTHGIALRAGSILLAGAATPAVALRAGATVTARITGFDEVKVRVDE